MSPDGGAAAFDDHPTSAWSPASRFLLPVYCYGRIVRKQEVNLSPYQAGAMLPKVYALTTRLCFDNVWGHDAYLVSLDQPYN
jgi:hypothetical protein